MDGPYGSLDYSPEAAKFRAQIRLMLEANLPAGWVGLGDKSLDEREEFCARWFSVLSENGLRAPGWPREYGGAGLSEIERVVLTEEMVRNGLPERMALDRFGIDMLGPTLIRWGTEAQKEYFLPRILSGEHRWCQGFSEPGAGSDLASLSTSAVLDGDEWVINGQKVWTTGAHNANWIFVLVRTDPGAARHAGISLLLCPMNQPGVEVQPIQTLVGNSDFNAVFFTDARTARSNVVGEVDDGWQVAMSLLGHERLGQASVLAYELDFERLKRMVDDVGKSSDPLLRQKLADAYTTLQILRFFSLRTTQNLVEGRPPGPEVGLGKLIWSRYLQTVSNIGVDVLGMGASVLEGRPPTPDSRVDDFNAPTVRLRGSVNFSALGHGRSSRGHRKSSTTSLVNAC